MADEPQPVTVADLETILALHDENTRRIVRDTLQEELPKVVGDAVQESLKVLNIERVDRVLFGDPPMHDGLVVTTSKVFETVEGHEDLLKQTRLVLRLAKYLLPVIGLGAVAQAWEPALNLLDTVFN